MSPAKIVRMARPKKPQPVPVADSTDRAVGERVKLAREHNKLSQEQLGEVLGLSKGALSRIEAGHRRLDPVSYASKMCKLFGCTHTWLYTGVATNEVETSLNLALSGASSSSSSKGSSRSRSRRSA